MNNLEKAKKVIRENYSDATSGIFNNRNVLGDITETLYEDEELAIDICYSNSYFEVLGLNDTEFEELEDYYYISLREESEEQYEPGD